MVIIRTTGNSPSDLCRPSRPRAPRPQRCHEARVAAAAAAQKRSDAYKAAIQSLLDDFQTRIDLVSREHSVPRDRVEAQVYRQAELFGQRRSSNVWNAYVHSRMTEANQARQPGDRLSLKDVISDQMRQDYRSLTEAERQTLSDEHAMLREGNRVGHLVSDRSAHQTAMAQLQRIDDSLQAMHQQHGFHFVFIAVRSSVTSYLKPHVSVTEDAENFFRLMTKQDPEKWAIRLESFCIGGLHALIQNDIATSGDLRGDIRKELGAKLAEVTGDPNAVMCYANYERDIVQKYRVVLEGWPFPVIRNLSEESASNSVLAKLLHSLRTDACYFRKLSDLELSQRLSASSSAIPTTPRKARRVRRGPQLATVHARLSDMQEALDEGSS